MALNRFAIADRGHEKFGELIKKWARNRDSRPHNLEEFKTQLEANGIEGIYPTGENELKDLNLIQGEVWRLDIRLPPAHLIDESEEYLKHNDYPLPKYYEDLFQSEAVIPEPKAKNRLRLHAARIGDYTVSNCA